MRMLVKCYEMDILKVVKTVLNPTTTTIIPQVNL